MEVVRYLADEVVAQVECAEVGEEHFRLVHGRQVRLVLLGTVLQPEADVRQTVVAQEQRPQVLQFVVSVVRADQLGRLVELST